MEFYVAILTGAVLALLLKLNKALKLDDFSWKSFFKLNGIPTIINLILGCVAVYAKDELVNIYNITFVSSLILGAAGQYIFKSLFDAVSPGVSTAIGLNE